jgi:hypothetical protein
VCFLIGKQTKINKPEQSNIAGADQPNNESEDEQRPKKKVRTNEN